MAKGILEPKGMDAARRVIFSLKVDLAVGLLANQVFKVFIASWLRFWYLQVMVGLCEIRRAPSCSRIS